MALKRQLIQFVIINETDCNYNLPLFQANQFSINATTKYSWDITSESLSCGTATIVINSVTLQITFAPTLAAFLSALNSLGFGFFCTETISGSTYLYTADDTNVYGGLEICGLAPITTSTTTSTTTAAPTTTTTTSTTTAVPVGTTTTTSTTTAAPVGTTTTTSTTTAAPVGTTTTTSTTTAAPVGTTTTTSTTTAAPVETTTTTSTTTAAPVETTTTTSTTTAAPVGTTTTTSTTTAAPIGTTTTTSTTTAALLCYEWNIYNGSLSQQTANWVDCCSGDSISELIDAGNAINVCSRTEPNGTSLTITGGTQDCQSNCDYLANDASNENISSETACLDATPQVLYTAAGTTFPNIGVVFYTDSSLETPYVGSEGWISMVWQGTQEYLQTIVGQLNSIGEVVNQNFALCGIATTTTTTSTTTAAPVETTTTTSTTTAAPVETTTTTSTTTAAPVETTTTTSTTTAAPVETTTTTSTTTAAPVETTTTTSTTTAAPVETTTTTSTTTAAPVETTTTTSTTTAAPVETTTTTSTTTAAPVETTTTTSTTTAAPVETTTTTSTTTAAPVETTTTTSTTTAAPVETTTTTSTTTAAPVGTTTTTSTTTAAPVGTTTTTSTTTIASFEFIGVVGKSAECCPTPIESLPSTVYSSCSVLTITTCSLFSDSGFTIVFSGRFTYGGNCYETDVTGTIIAITPCATTTTTTTTSTTTTAGFYYTATQYLNCVQNSAVGEFILFSATAVTQPWVCGDDSFQYEIVTDTTVQPIDANVVSSANTCLGLIC